MIKEHLTTIFDVFSRRQVCHQQRELGDLSDQLRNRILLLYRDIFSGAWGPPGSSAYSTGDFTPEFWQEMHNALQHLYGRFKLSTYNERNNVDDILSFLTICETSEFFDFIELSFKSNTFRRIMYDKETDVVNAINEIFRVEDAPYQLTGIVKIRKNEKGAPYKKVSSFPQIILLESEVIHEEAIAPALSILGASHFETANTEFRAALNEYKEGQHDNCLTKCGSAFESVLKILCKRNEWPFSETDTITPLLKAIIKNSSLDSFFEQPLTLIATIRNHLSSSHGAGNNPRIAEQHVAQYMISITAASLVLLVNEVDK